VSAIHHDRSLPPHARRLALVLALTCAYMIAELAGAWAANSLALLADAGHMLSDAAALALSLFAIWAARRPAGRASTFGHHRAEILAALVNGSVLLLIALFIFLEALERLREPPAVAGPLMLVVASGGLAMNLAGLGLLAPARNTSLNLRGAWLHVFSDALGSIAAMIAAAVIWTTGWSWADPLASIVIAIFIVHSAWALLRETVAVLMEIAPGHIDVDEVQAAIGTMNGVAEVHDLHVWSITSGMESLSAHVLTHPDSDADALLSSIRHLLAERFGIGHVTIQIERAAGGECGNCR
jgi:cobalt-zinc-cadmium efflux system protein